jgi:sulfatase modifying factor 1
VVVGRCFAVVLVAVATVGVSHACEVEESAAAGAAEAVPTAVPHEKAALPPEDEIAPDERPAPAVMACPDGMILVEGMYCPQAKQVCKRWMDPPSSPYAFYRCAEYAEPATCLSAERVHERFCIDREELVRPGDALPLVNQSWTSASRICESQAKRLCLESEWQFACEGEEMRPYPYGFSRASSLCNIDQPHLGKPQAGLTDLRAPVTAYPECLSPFGVHDMSGNVEEWTTLDGKAGQAGAGRSAMKGAWWLPGRNNCRAATLGHGEIYGGPQVGVRCCADAR